MPSSTFLALSLTSSLGLIKEREMLCVDGENSGFMHVPSSAVGGGTQGPK